MKRILCFILALAIIIVSLSGCWWFKSYMGKRPVDQPDTKWISEDGQINFWINEDGTGIGKMVNGDETINIFIDFGPACEIEICLLDSVKQSEDGLRFLVEYDDVFEHWVGDFKYKDHFTATVKRTTYFNVGDKITFYRVDVDASFPVSTPDEVV